MGRALNRLSAVAVNTGINRRGMYHDGGGLYLQVSAGGAKSWIFRFMLVGRAREMGLGPLHTIPLAEARKRAAASRRMRLDGIDPIEARSAHRDQKKLEAAKAMTFDACAAAYIDAHKAGWQNAKHREQWPNTLNTYAGPVFGSLPVQAIDVGLVMKALELIWQTKPETASRLRGRIEAVLDWATVRGYRKGENPARWRGHLDKLLPARSKVRKVKHHPTLPYNEIADFFTILRKQEGVASKALEFSILTAARTGEAIGARWDEVDLGEKIWIVPAARMKAGRAALRSGCCRSRSDEGDPRKRVRVFRRQGGQAALEHGDAGRSQADGSGSAYCPRFPLKLPRLGGGTHEVPARGRRNGAGAHSRRQGRGSIPSRRPVPEAPAADGGTGALLRDREGSG